MRARVVLGVAVVVATGGLATSPLDAATQPQQWPVIGCDQLSKPSENHLSLRYAPADMCQTGGPLGTIEGIDNVHWHHWGAARATGRGDLIDGLGYAYNARITAYGLVTTNSFRGHHYAAWYTRLHIVAKARHRAGAKRGPFDLTVDVTPQFRSHR